LKILGREIVQTRRAKDRILTAKSQLNSVSMALQTSISMIKLQGVLSTSTEVMALMNGLVKFPEVRETMTNLAREMERAGLIEEVVSDTFSVVDPDSLEFEADEEVNKVISELTADLLAPAGPAPTSTIIKSGVTAASGNFLSTSDSELVDTEAQADLLALQARLGAL
jgi:charged multivesicular body protein 3